MAASAVREILVRILLDPGFYELITNSPGEALGGYDLTEEEKRLLSQRDKSLYAYMGGADEPGEYVIPDMVHPVINAPVEPMHLQPMQPQFGELELEDTPVKGAVIGDFEYKPDSTKLNPVLREIRSLTGSQRTDRIKQLIQEIPTLGAYERKRGEEGKETTAFGMLGRQAIDIYVVGTGIVNVRHITKEVEHALKLSQEVLCVAGTFGLAEYLQSICPEAKLTNLGETYKPDSPRLDTYETMAAMVIDAALSHSPVTFALYGHPLIFAYPPFLVKFLAGLFGLRVKILPGISSMDCAFVDLEIDPATHGLQMYEATDLLIRERPLQPDVACLLWQVGSIETGLYSIRPNKPVRFSNLKKYLLNFYPPGHKLFAVSSSSFPMFPSLVSAIEIQNIEEHADELGFGVTLYIPPAEVREIRNTELAAKLKSVEHLKSMTHAPSAKD